MMDIFHLFVEQVWNLETFLPIQSLSRHQGGVNALAICGNVVLSGSEDHEIKVWHSYLFVCVCVSVFSTPLHGRTFTLHVCYCFLNFKEEIAHVLARPCRQKPSQI